MKQINNNLITKVIIKRLENLDYPKDKKKMKSLCELKNLIDFIIEKESQTDLELRDYNFGILELFPNK